MKKEQTHNRTPITPRIQWKLLCRLF